jgi:hypothetical protein
VSRAGLCTIAVAIAAGGCGGGHQSPARASLPPADARELSRLARAYQQASVTVTARVEDRLVGEYNLCPLTRSNPNGAPGRPGEQQFVVLQQAAILQALLPRYRALARRLRLIDPAALQLRDAARAMTTVAAVYRPLQDADTNYCSILRKWRARQWEPRFDVANAVGAAILMKPPPRRVEAAYATLARTVLALRTAGGAARDVTLLLRFTRMFWAPVA